MNEQKDELNSLESQLSSGYNLAATTSNTTPQSSAQTRQGAQSSVGYKLFEMDKDRELAVL